jgi:ribonuclease P protein component
LAKRRVRELVRELMPQYAKLQMDYVIIARREIATAEFKKIYDDLKFCLKRIHQVSSNKKA